MLTQTEVPLIKELIDNMRRWNLERITLKEYKARALRKGHELTPKELRLLSEQARRSRIIRITYRKVSKQIETIFNLHEPV